MKNHKTAKRGVTLVEIAIVLVIIGLLLGGVLKGQELINNAKIRSIADRQTSIKVAWFSFIDRYQALPGDYVNAAASIPGAANGGGNGELTEIESPLAFQHMTGAGYLRCPQCTSKSLTGNPTAKNSLQNQYGGIMAIFHDSDNYAAVGGPSGAILYIHSGNQIPSNIIAEVDRKLDDGIANSGDVVFNKWVTAAGGSAPKAAECMAKTYSAADAKNAEGGSLGLAVKAYWRGGLATPPVEQNCAASVAI